MTIVDPALSTVIPFSRLIRERSKASHGTSEGTSFMTDLLSGAGSRDDYIALVRQHHEIYTALETAADALRTHAEVAPFLSSALTRLPALNADLTFLVGDDWAERIPLLPTTVRYAARIREVAATWPAGYVAHHYTRYLGDLSGGLHIGRVLARRFGFDTNGIGFYLFDQIADPAAFKDTYRAQLDAVPWDDAERERVVDEVLTAYRFNTELFVDLDEARGTRAA
ncbi:heme oxygenase [Microcella alkaliphila]|uniref:Heme oxygenase n=1 Tax=Microcella alkaliphila TaxID=279828 RepID=A0A4Q7TFU7_9MICO|nr:biliverdin-producing heme oxygenase [Microcella alkaliphila]RZT58288.1 heme oxygenase [Microcella alkaliphila]